MARQPRFASKVTKLGSHLFFNPGTITPVIGIHRKEGNATPEDAVPPLRKEPMRRLDTASWSTNQSTSLKGNIMKARHPTEHREKLAPHSPANQFIYCGFTFEILEKAQGVVDGIECDYWRLAALVPQPNGLCERSRFTVRVTDQVTLIQSLNAAVGMIQFEQMAAECFAQMDAEQGAHHA